MNVWTVARVLWKKQPKKEEVGVSPKSGYLYGKTEASSVSARGGVALAAKVRAVRG